MEVTSWFSGDKRGFGANKPRDVEIWTPIYNIIRKEENNKIIK